MRDVGGIFVAWIWDWKIDFDGIFEYSISFSGRGMLELIFRTGYYEVLGIGMVRIVIV